MEAQGDLALAVAGVERKIISGVGSGIEISPARVIRVVLLRAEGVTDEVSDSLGVGHCAV